MEKIKILILIKPFGKKYPKHKQKYDIIREIEKVADVTYWHQDGEISNILERIKVKPDFILHYDTAWNYRYAPKIKGLEKISIPKGCVVIDMHWNNDKRKKYFVQNKIDLIFSVSKYPFLEVFPQFKEKFRWFPFSINPKVIKDYGKKKTIRYMLMGLVHLKDQQSPPKGRYKFREAVLKKFKKKKKKGFVFHPHPGHYIRKKRGAMVDRRYAEELNRARIFFTCGGEYHYPVIKFFEVPGCKTLLLAEPNKDIWELGFEDGKNFVACNRSDFYKKALYYLKHKEMRKKIARNGYKFIHKHHTNRVRAKQLIKMIQEHLNRGKNHKEADPN